MSLPKKFTKYLLKYKISNFNSSPQVRAAPSLRTIALQSTMNLPRYFSGLQPTVRRIFTSPSCKTVRVSQHVDCHAHFSNKLSTSTGRTKGNFSSIGRCRTSSVVVKIAGPLNRTDFGDLNNVGSKLPSKKHLKSINSSSRTNSDVNNPVNPCSYLSTNRSKSASFSGRTNTGVHNIINQCFYVATNPPRIATSFATNNAGVYNFEYQFRYFSTKPPRISNSLDKSNPSDVTQVCQQRHLSSKPPKIDKSRLPELREEDLEEKFIRGWGPGGQSINKTSSAVYLRHIPTGLFVKCQKHRGQHQNRQEARVLLQLKWDELLNGEDSVTAQRQRLLETKSAKREAKAKKRRQLKEEWKKSLEKDVSASTSAGDDGTEVAREETDQNTAGTSGLVKELEK